MTVVTECTECSNQATVWADDPRPLCEWCAHNEQCEIPSFVSFYVTNITGEPRARCNDCFKAWAFWECACDFVHDCEASKCD